MNSRTQKIILFLLLLGLGFFYFSLTKNLYFRLDEWDILQRAKNPTFANIMAPYGEQFQPLFHCLYFLEFKLFKLNHLPYQIIVIVIHLLNVFIFYNILKFSSKNFVLNLYILVIYGFSSLYGQILFWTLKTSFLLDAMFQLLSLYFLFRFLKEEKNIFLAGSAIFAFLSPFFFGSGILFPTVLVVLLFVHYLLQSRKINYAAVLSLLAAQSGYLIPYFMWAGFGSLFANKPSFGLQRIPSMVSYFAHGLFDGLLNRFFFRITYFRHSILIGCFPLLLLLFLAILLIKEKDEQFVSIACWVNIIYMYGIITPIRYQLGWQQASTLGYTYLPLVFLLLFLQILFKNLYKRKRAYIVICFYFLLLLPSNISTLRNESAALSSSSKPDISFIENFEKE